MAKTDQITDQDLEQLSSLFRLLADKTRLTILLELAEGERNVSSLCEKLNLPQPTVSHHLGLLRMNNIVSNRRDGKQVYYGLMGLGQNNGSPRLMQFAVQNLLVQVKQRDD